MRVPLYEVVPLDLIMQHCWVLDLTTFCKGRPVNAPEEHIYICEYRVDKSAHLFAKIAKPYPICTKNYAFNTFDVRLRPVRTYTVSVACLLIISLHTSLIMQFILTQTNILRIVVKKAL